MIKEKLISNINSIEHYPDPGAKRLRETLATKNNVSSNNIILTNGAAELIHIIGYQLQKQRVLILEPTFSEYYTTCTTFGCQVEQLLYEELHTNIEIFNRFPNVKAIFICNPSNPSGEILTNEQLELLIQEAEKNDAYIIIDEAFYDFLEDGFSYVHLIHRYPNMIILRSLTKMYGLAGLRIGYGIMSPKLVCQLSLFLPHWNVNSLAILAGEMIEDLDDFVQHTRAYVKKEREFVFSKLSQLGFEHSNSKVNYFLLRDPQYEDQKELLQFCMEKGIVPRHTYNFNTLEGKWLRFAIKKKEENQMLLGALTEWKRHN